MNSFEQYMLFWELMYSYIGVILLLIATVVLLGLIIYLGVYVSYLNPKNALKLLTDFLYWIRYGILWIFVFIIAFVGVVVIAYYPQVGLYLYVLDVLIVLAIGHEVITEIEKYLDKKWIKVSYCDSCGKEIDNNLFNECYECLKKKEKK